MALVVSLRRLSLVQAWARDLSARVPGLALLTVADWPVGTPVDLERAAAILRRRVPAGVSVLMDPEHGWAQTFGLNTALPNLLLFDEQGLLTAQFRGRWTPALAAGVVAALTSPGSTP